LTLNPFKILADQTRLSVRGIARVLGVSPRRVLLWLKGTRAAPEGVLIELREYIRGMVTNA